MVAAVALAGCSPGEKTTALPEVTSVESITTPPTDEPEPATTLTTPELASPTAPRVTPRPETTTTSTVIAEKLEREAVPPAEMARIVAASGFEALGREKLHRLHSFVVPDGVSPQGRQVVVVGVGEATPRVTMEEIEKDFQLAAKVAVLRQPAVAPGLWLGPGFQTSVEFTPRPSDQTPNTPDTSYVIVADKALSTLTSPVDIDALAQTTEGQSSISTLGLTVRQPYLDGRGVTVTLLQNAASTEKIDGQNATRRVIGTEAGHAMFGFDLVPEYERSVLDVTPRPDMSYVLRGGTLRDQKDELARKAGDIWQNSFWYMVQELREGRTYDPRAATQIPMYADEFQDKDMGAMYIGMDRGLVKLVSELLAA